VVHAGCEALVPCLEELLAGAAANGALSVVLTMPHRGRLNTMVNLLNYPAVGMFAKTSGKPEWQIEGTAGTGDVLSHLGAYSARFVCVFSRVVGAWLWFAVNVVVS